MSDLIISVKEAGELLGKKYDYMTDEQIEAARARARKQRLKQ